MIFSYYNIYHNMIFFNKDVFLQKTYTLLRITNATTKQNACRKDIVNSTAVHIGASPHEGDSPCYASPQALVFKAKKYL